MQGKGHFWKTYFSVPGGLRFEGGGHRPPPPGYATDLGVEIENENCVRILYVRVRSTQAWVIR